MPTIPGTNTPPDGLAEGSAAATLGSVWPPSGTRMADLLDLMILKAITDCTVTPDGLDQFAALGTPEFALKLTTHKSVAGMSFADLVNGAFTPEEVFVRHLSKHTTFHDATSPTYGTGFKFRIILNWSAQTANVTTIRDPSSVKTERT